MEGSSLPTYVVVEQGEFEGTTYSILTKGQVYALPQSIRTGFIATGQATHTEGTNKTIFITPSVASKTTITSSRVKVSQASAQEDDYLGSVTDFLSSAYKFSRKSKKAPLSKIQLLSNIPSLQKILSLVWARNQTRQWGNGRGDIQGNPKFFKQISENFAKEHDVKITVIAGKDLLKERFRLLHAVGRASKNQPIFVNLSYKGNPDSDIWTAYVGKGVCFDAGGLDIKTAAGMKDMYLDKCGAMTVLAAFQAIVREKIPINLTASIGLVENFISQNSYRPSDIIESRKGLTVQIGNTDAQGRLVLADCMNWTQQHFKVDTLIQLSTLTGAVVTALGHHEAGLFSNDEGLVQTLKSIGSKVHEYSWHLPCHDYHKKLVTPKFADLTNSSGKTEASSSQAAAFLKHFVQKDTKWAHLDIAGVGMVASESTGWGSRVLVEYAYQLASKN